MKYFFLSFIFLSSVSGFYGQTVQDLKEGKIAFGNNPHTMNYFNNFREIMDKRNAAAKTTAENIKGSPYDTEDFVRGTLNIGGKTYENVWLRYNAYADEVETKLTDPATGQEERYAFTKQPGPSYIIHDEKIKYLSFQEKNKETGGNLFVVYEGENYSLYKRKLKLYKESKRATTSLQGSFPARFVEDEEYYLKAGARPPVHIKLKPKKILDFLRGEEKNKFKAYLKKEKPDVKDQQQLVRLLVYMNQL